MAENGRWSLEQVALVENSGDGSKMGGGVSKRVSGG